MYYIYVYYISSPKNVIPYLLGWYFNLFDQMFQLVHWLDARIEDDGMH